MQRLVQGDVGSGKTVIAALAAARAIESGWQAALMAPTELLAEQHFGRIAEWLTPLGVRTTWLAGRLGAAAKRAAQQLVSSGTAQLAIGTHALIQDAVNYDRLGLAIVDEQHRFGVAQRLALRGSDRALLPHMLMLSATPIPRTLAMSFLADLDVSVIDELPPGRTPIRTRLISNARRHDVLARIRDEAHRFANTFHGERRSKRMVASSLDGIPGLGEARKKQLTKAMGGVNAVKRAALEELQALSFLPDAVAQAVYDKYHS